MSTSAVGPAAAGAALWGRQVLSILRLEVRKAFLGRRLIGVYLLALAPVLLLGARAVLTLGPRGAGNMGQAGIVFAGLFQLFILRIAIFFGCVAIFTNLFRGETLEKTLHFYLLSPVRREVLVAGKYLAGLAAAAVLFVASTALSFWLLYVPYGSDALSRYFFAGPGLQQIGAYMGVALLACVGYGAVFTLTGLWVRNPMIPAAVIMVWEGSNFFLPALFQKLSVIHYLQSLCPVALPAEPLAILVEPTPAWVSVPGLLAVTALVMVLAGLRIRRSEITYSTD